MSKFCHPRPSASLDLPDTFGKFIQSQAFGHAPLDWLKVAEDIVCQRGIDLLFPTQEQVTVLSARRNVLKCATVVPAFESLLRVQDKVSAFRTLETAGIPQPPTFLSFNIPRIWPRSKDFRPSSSAP